MEGIKFVTGSIEYTADKTLEDAFELFDEWGGKGSLFVQLFKSGTYDGIVVPPQKTKKLKRFLKRFTE